MSTKNKQKNVLGEDLEECSNDPLTGWFRDGCCNTDENDHGLHTVCAKVTLFADAEVVSFYKRQGWMLEPRGSKCAFWYAN